VLAPHPRHARFDAFWLVGGGVADWAVLDDVADVHEHTLDVLRRAGVYGAAAQLARERVAEARIVQTWLAARDAVPALELEPVPGRAQVEEFVAAATSA
jgi:hypothetical protein